MAKLTPAEFFAKYAKAAQDTCHGTGLCASVCLAQAAIESGWGGSGLAANYNNFGGIKAAWDWKGKSVGFNTREVIKGQNVVVKALFRVYDSAAHYFKGRMEFLRANPRYRRLFAADNYVSEAQAFQAAGYATDPHYAATLISVVAKYGLTKYDVVSGVADPALAAALFPIPIAAIQGALNQLGHQVVVDGKLGPRTLAAINGADATQLLATI